MKLTASSKQAKQLWGRTFRIINSQLNILYQGIKVGLKEIFYINERRLVIYIVI